MIEGSLSANLWMMTLIMQMFRPTKRGPTNDTALPRSTSCSKETEKFIIELSRRVDTVERWERLRDLMQQPLKWGMTRPVMGRQQLIWMYAVGYFQNDLHFIKRLVWFWLPLTHNLFHYGRYKLESFDSSACCIGVRCYQLRTIQCVSRLWAVLAFDFAETTAYLLSTTITMGEVFHKYAM